MSLIKCKECGHEVSDRASACPNCGCPLEKESICNECGQLVPNGVDVCPNCGCPLVEIDIDRTRVYSSNNDYTEEKKKRMKPLWIILTIIALLFGFGTFFFLKNEDVLSLIEEIGGQSVSALPDEMKGKYAIVLYHDNVGEFYNPKGGRLCSFRLTNGRQEPLTLELSQSLYIMGKSTDRIYITNDRMFAEYMDYVNYNSSYNPDKSLGVAAEKKDKDEGTYFLISLDKNTIEQKEVPIHQIKPSKDVEYTLLYFNDEYGILYDSKGQRLCGVRNGTTIVGDLNVKLSKTINVYGVTTSELSIKGDNLYTTEHDLIGDRYKRDDEPSKRVATVVRTDDKDATIYSFSKAGIASDNGKANVGTQSKSSQWNITSEDELRRKIAGTIWTCRPRGGTWYRLVFTQDNLKLYYATPSQGHWKEEQSKIWNWHTHEGYTSDTGEKCFSIQITEPGNDFSFGALIFFKNGDIEFNWLRGKEGGNAECMDFSWE